MTTRLENVLFLFNPSEFHDHQGSQFVWERLASDHRSMGERWTSKSFMWLLSKIADHPSYAIKYSRAPYLCGCGAKWPLTTALLKYRNLLWPGQSVIILFCSDTFSFNCLFLRLSSCRKGGDYNHVFSYSWSWFSFECIARLPRRTPSHHNTRAGDVPTDPKLLMSSNGE